MYYKYILLHRSNLNMSAKCFLLCYFREREDCESNRRRMKRNTENVTGNRPNMDQECIHVVCCTYTMSGPIWMMIWIWSEWWSKWPIVFVIENQISGWPNANWFFSNWHSAISSENEKILVWQFYSNVANPRRESASRLLCGHIFGTSSRVGGYLKNYILGRVEN